MLLYILYSAAAKKSLYVSANKKNGGKLTLSAVFFKLYQSSFVTSFIMPDVWQ